MQKLSLVYHTEEDSLVVHTKKIACKQESRDCTQRGCARPISAKAVCKSENFSLLYWCLGFCETLMHKTYTRLLCNSRAILISSSKFFEESRRFWQQSRLHVNQREKQRLRRTKKSNNFCFQVVVFTGISKVTRRACYKGWTKGNFVFKWFMILKLMYWRHPDGMGR